MSEVTTNLGRVTLVPKGEYDPAAQYERLDETHIRVLIL